MTAPVKPSAPLSRAEFGAMSAMAKARQDNLVSTFTGAKIVYGKTAAGERRRRS